MLSLLIHLATLSVVVLYDGMVVSVPVGGGGYIETVLVDSLGKAKGSPGVPIGSGRGKSADRAPTSVPVPLVKRLQAPESYGATPAKPSPVETTPEGKVARVGEKNKSEKITVSDFQIPSEPEAALQEVDDGEELSFASYAGGEEGKLDRDSSLPDSASLQATRVGSGYGYSESGEDEFQHWGSRQRLEKPEYPRHSRERGEQGSVLLVVTVFSSGAPGDIKVLRSSGHKRLDRAAVLAVERSFFTAPQGPYYIKLAFRFRLEDPG